MDAWAEKLFAQRDKADRSAAIAVPALEDPNLTLEEAQRLAELLGWACKEMDALAHAIGQAAAPAVFANAASALHSKWNLLLAASKERLQQLESSPVSGPEHEP